MLIPKCLVKKMQSTTTEGKVLESSNILQDWQRKIRTGGSYLEYSNDCRHLQRRSLLTIRDFIFKY